MLVFLIVAVLLHFSVSDISEMNYHVAFSSVPSNYKLQVDSNLRTTLPGRTKIGCVRSCIADSSCKAVNTDDDGTCEILETDLCEGKGYLVLSPGSRYYVMESAFTDHSLTERQNNSCMTDYLCTENCHVGYISEDVAILGRSCSDNEHCSLLLHGECRGGECRCVLGYSYNSRNDSCTAGCSQYGNNYTREAGLSLAGHNTVTLSDVSVQHCLDQCTGAEFTCRSVDLNFQTKQCFLSDASCHEFPEDCIQSSLDHYTRNCI